MLISSALVIAGCSINPTPVGPKAFAFKTDYTLEIIKRVRCEARDAMVVRAAKLLLQLNDYDQNKIIADQFLKNPSAVKKYQDWELDPRAFILASPTLGSTIAFDFIFTTTEKNDDSFTPKLTSTVGGNIFTLGLTQSNFNKERQNKRLANVAARNFDTFQTLNCHDDEKDRKATAAKKDFSYPLRGNIELAKTINTYIGFLNLDVEQQPISYRVDLAYDAMREAMGVLDSRIIDENVSKKDGRIQALAKIEEMREVIKNTGKEKCESLDSCKNTRSCFSYVLGQASDIYIGKFYSAFNISLDPKVSMTDTLKFTTTVSGGLEPKVVYGSPSTFDIESLAFTFKPSRTDQHQVQVSFVAPIPTSPKKKTTKEVFAKGNKGSKLFIDTPTKEVEVASLPDFCSDYINQPELKVKKPPNAPPNASTTSADRMTNNNTAFQIRQDSESVRREKNREIEKLRNEADKQVFIDNFRQAIE